VRHVEESHLRGHGRRLSLGVEHVRPVLSSRVGGVYRTDWSCSAMATSHDLPGRSLALPGGVARFSKPPCQPNPGRLIS
jgi:hypothetical protein